TRPNGNFFWAIVLVPLLVPTASILAQPPNQKTYVRKDVSALTPGEIDSLRKGVQVMKERDPKDPTSWLYQANIHGTTELPLQDGWAQCQHGTFFFLSWHRMY